MNRRTERPVLSGDATKAAGVRFKENSTNPQRSSQIPTAAQQHQVILNKYIERIKTFIAISSNANKSEVNVNAI